MSKLFIFTGVPGAGVSRLTYLLAKVYKQNGKNVDILNLDPAKMFKDLKILGNKPPVKFLNQFVYKNVNHFSLKDTESINSAKLATKIRTQVLKRITKDTSSIIQGGSSFYIKSFLTGASDYLSPEEWKRYDECRKIAKDVIEYDGNFSRTVERLSNNDKSFNPSDLRENDFYRLERRYADYLFYGENAHKKLQEREKSMRNKNNIKDFVHPVPVFFYTDRSTICQMAQYKAINLLREGAVLEVIDLLRNGILAPQKLSDPTNIIRNIAGINDFLDLLLDIHQLKGDFNHYDAAFEPENKNLKHQRNELRKIFGDFIWRYTTGIQRYSVKQIKDFKTNRLALCIQITEKSQFKDIISKVMEFSQLHGENRKMAILESINSMDAATKSTNTLNPKMFHQLIELTDISQIVKDIFKDLPSIKNHLDEFIKFYEQDPNPKTMLDYKAIQKYL